MSDMPSSDPRSHAQDEHCNAICGVENLSFSYARDGSPLLDELCLELFPGQKIGLSGDNGSGKTTFFRCLVGLLKPDKGIIRHAGEIMKSEKDFVRMRRNVGLVLQDAEDQLFFPTLMEDLVFGPLNQGLAPDAARERALDALELVGLAGFGDRLANCLSGGEKKLASLAAILAMRPKALLLDEPLNGLDARARLRILDLLEKLDCAMIIVSHDPECLERVCSRTLVLGHGRLREQARNISSGKIARTGKNSVLL